MKGKSILAIGMAAGVLAVATWGFTAGFKASPQRAPEHQENAESGAPQKSGESSISLNHAGLSRTGIVATPLRGVSHQQEVRAYGVVLSMQDLIDLNNRYVAAQSQLEKAHAVLETSRREYERLRALHGDEHNISDKAFQAAEGAWRSDQANLRAAQEALNAVTRNAQQQWGDVLVKAVLQGSPLFTRFVNHQEALLQITAPSGAPVSPPPPTAKVEAARGTFVTATLLSPAPKTDPRFQGVSFFYRAAATALLPGMTVTAYLPLGSALEGVVIPASAVVWWQGAAWAYVQQKPGRFVRRILSTDYPVEGGWFVAKGFESGGMIVVTGAQQLLSQEFRAQIQSGEGGEGGESGESGESGEKNEKAEQIKKDEKNEKGERE